MPVDPRKLKALVSSESRGPFIGPRGGKWKDSEHTKHWTEGEVGQEQSAVPGLQTKAASFSSAWLGRHPDMQRLHDALVTSVEDGKARASEEASYEQGKIVLKPKFYEMADKYGQQTADYLYAHELAHGIESTVPEWRDQATTLGIDVWDVSALPLGQFNMDEAFAESAATVITKDPDGMRLLDERWPAWRKLAEWGIQRATLRGAR